MPLTDFNPPGAEKMKWMSSGRNLDVILIEYSLWSIHK